MKIDVALSGAGGKCPAHVGVLSAVHKTGHEVRYFSACSSGAVIACAVALGHSLDWIWEQVCRLPWSNVVSFGPSALVRFALTGFLTNGRALMEILSHLFGDTPMRQLRPPVYIAVSDLYEQRLVLLSPDEHPAMLVRDAVFASCCLPGVFRPHAHTAYRDGGIYCDFPIRYPVVPRSVPRLGSLVIGGPLPPLKWRLLRFFSSGWTGFHELRLLHDCHVTSNRDGDLALAAWQVTNDRVRVVRTDLPYPATQFEFNRTELEAMRQTGYENAMRTLHNWPQT